MKHLSRILRNATLGTALVLAGLLLAPATARAQGSGTSAINTVTEDFTGNTFAHPNDWQVGRLAYYSTTVPFLTAAQTDPDTGLIDTTGKGWLRLTNRNQHQSGYIRYKGAPIKTRESDGRGLTIYAAFDFVSWNSSGSDDAGSNGAHSQVGGDGTSFFIYDANFTNSFHPGGKGGSLGYAQLSIMHTAGLNAAASGLVARAANMNRVDLFWNDNTGLEEGFDVERSTDNATWTKLVTSGSSWTVPNNCCHFIDTTVAANTTYYYRVRARGAVLTSDYAAATAYSPTATVTTPASAGTTSGGAIPIEIYAQENPGKSSSFDTIYMTINGNTVASWTMSAGWATYTTTVSSSFSLNQVRIYFVPNNNDNNTWWDYGQIDYIKINGNTYQAESCANSCYASASYNWQGTLIYNYTAFNQNMTTNRTQYMVHSGYFDFSTYPSAASTSFSIATPPNAPSGLTATVSTTLPQVTLNWTDNSAAETGFRIEYSAGTLGGWGTLATVAANVKTYTANLAYGVSYKFRVRSLNGSSYSAASNEVSATTIAAASGTLIVVRAMGVTGTESITLQLDTNKDGNYTDETASFSLGTTFADYYYYTTSTVTPGMVRINYPTDTGSLIVESVTLGTSAYYARNCVFNSAVTNPVDGGRAFTSFSEWMINAGYIDFSDYSTGDPIDAMGGVSGGYIGVGMDDWGNYSWEGDFGGTSNEGRVGHSDNTEYSAYPGYSRHAIAVRGDETSHYEYIVGTGDRNVEDVGKSLSFPDATTRPTLKADLRRLSVIITPQNQLTVFLKVGTSDMKAIFTADLSSQVRPDTISFGFAASSGGATDYHEIRNVVVTSFKSLLWTNAGFGLETVPGDLNWNTDKNWLVNKTPAKAGYQDVEFDTQIRRANGPGVVKNTDATSPYYNLDMENVCLDGAISIHTVTFSAPFPTSSADTIGIIYRLYGNPLTLNSTTEGASINSNAGRHMVDCNLISQEEFNFNSVKDAILYVNGDVDNGGHLLRLTGLGTVTLTTSASKFLHGEGGLKIEDAGTFNLFGTVNNTYAGVNIMQEGLLNLKIVNPATETVSNGKSTTVDTTSGKYPYVYHDATGTGPIVLQSVDSFTSTVSTTAGSNNDGLSSTGTSSDSTRKSSRIYLNHHNQINNNADMQLDGGELHLNGNNECGDDLP